VIKEQGLFAMVVYPLLKVQQESSIVGEVGQVGNLGFDILAFIFLF
jgi:hypothetical protein